MKFISYEYLEVNKVGVLSKEENRVYDLKDLGFVYKDMSEAIADLTLDDIKSIKNKIEQEDVKSSLLENVKLLAPIEHPRQDIICLGLNYRDHAEEFTKSKYTEENKFPVYFSKRVNKSVAPFGDIDGHLDMVKDLDYEVELAFVLGKDAKDIKAEDAANYIFGYTIINDVTARTMQKQHEQWYRGKSLDGFTPMGPCIVTTDEFEFPPKRKIWCKVNGEIRQNSNTDHLIFSIPYILEELSRGMTLKAGTIISTGTPGGVAVGMANPKYLKKGDKVECYIEGIGKIVNTVK
ncbi:fumarylacetoacetate hydrolase family protein [Terrisporobacter sp.]